MAQFIRQVTASGEEHGLINVLTNSNPFDDFKNFTPEHKAEMIRLKKEDSKMVKIEFVHKGGRLERWQETYCKYSGDPIQIWRLIPGRTYEIPLGLVKQINAKTTMRRSGLVSLDGDKVTPTGAPLEKDEEGEWIVKCVKADTF